MTDPDSPRAGPGGRGETEAIAAMMGDLARLLEAQGEDGFRLRAWRRGAATLRGLDRPVRSLWQEGGAPALTALPGIGSGIASAVGEILETGRWRQLERLNGEMAPERLFRSLPGIGPALAARLAGEAGLESLEDLEAALARGADLPGIGPRRAEALRAVLADRLGRGRQVRPTPGAEPGVDLLLRVDAMYRERAARGVLARIAPRRFNPEGRAWLPILHARHGDWHFTALFSNTELAHRLGRTDDWVVIYFQEDDGPEGRRTVVTETRGPLAGMRVVRGREAETARHRAGSA